MLTTKRNRIILIISLVPLTLLLINGCPSGMLTEIITDNAKLNKPVLIEEPLALSCGSTYNFSFSLKYPGRYDLSLFLESSEYHDNHSNDWHNDDFQSFIKLNLELFLDSNVLVSQELNLNIGKGFLGRTISIVDCPKELPKGKLITGRLTFLDVDEGIYNRYSHATLIIKRISSLLR